METACQNVKTQGCSSTYEGGTGSKGNTVLHVFRHLYNVVSGGLERWLESRLGRVFTLSAVRRQSGRTKLTIGKMWCIVQERKTK